MRFSWIFFTITEPMFRSIRSSQAFFREYQPPALIVWGKNDDIFASEGAAPYARDLKRVETHMLDTGHFALETHGEQIAEHILRFLSRLGTTSAVGTHSH